VDDTLARVHPGLRACEQLAGAQPDAQWKGDLTHEPIVPEGFEDVKRTVVIVHGRRNRRRHRPRERT
jgi:hypothetical protein